jgi:ferrous iron transport protein A
MTAVVTAAPSRPAAWTTLEEIDTLALARCLSQLLPGQTGRVHSVQGEPQLALRILELGLVAGTPVRLLRAAPLGGPIEVEVDGFFLSLRRSEADAVLIEV